MKIWSKEWLQYEAKLSICAYNLSSRDDILRIRESVLINYKERDKLVLTGCKIVDMIWTIPYQIYMMI
jgi:hypothetical protein